MHVHVRARNKNIRSVKNRFTMYVYVEVLEQFYELDSAFDILIALHYNPFQTNGIFNKATYNNVKMDHCIHLGVTINYD